MCINKSTFMELKKENIDDEIMFLINAQNKLKMKTKKRKELQEEYVECEW